MSARPLRKIWCPKRVYLGLTNQIFLNYLTLIIIKLLGLSVTDRILSDGTLPLNRCFIIFVLKLQFVKLVGILPRLKILVTKCLELEMLHGPNFQGIQTEMALSFANCVSQKSA